MSMYKSVLIATAGVFFMTQSALAQSPPKYFPVKASTLKVPGAKIYYETRGSGPLLLMIPGGPADAGAFAEIGQRLADRYTVVAYDPRGNSRSTFDGAPEGQSIDAHGDDASRLLAALGKEPAFVFGSSGGAQIGLNLAARHPEQVRLLVAHEPPCISLLDDPSKSIANNQEVYETYQRQGTAVAIQKFMAMNGMTPPNNGSAPPMPPPAMETFARIQNNFDYFLAHILVPISLYRPDVNTLRANKTRVVVGVGEETSGQTANRTGVALAKKLNVAPVVFPGDHNGYGPHAAAFSDTLDRALNGK